MDETMEMLRKNDLQILDGSNEIPDSGKWVYFLAGQGALFLKEDRSGGEMKSKPVIMEHFNTVHTSFVVNFTFNRRIDKFKKRASALVSLKVSRPKQYLREALCLICFHE